LWGGVVVQLHSFLNAALCGCVWSFSHPVCFTPGKEPQTIELGIGWAPEPLRTCWKSNKPLALPDILRRTLDCSACSLVATH